MVVCRRMLMLGRPQINVPDMSCFTSIRRELMAFTGRTENRLILLFILISVALIWLSCRYTHLTGMDQPKFSQIDQFEAIYEQLITGYFHSIFHSFQAFLVVDFIWGLLLIILVGRYFKMYLFDGGSIKNKGIWRCWILFAAAAIAFHGYENVCYSSGIDNWLSIAILIRKLSYVITLFICPLFAYCYYESVEIWIQIWRFFKTSVISLLVIAIIGGMVTFLPQGATIMIDILERPINLVYSFFLINLLAILVSHYPRYIGIANDEQIRSRFNLCLGRFIPGVKFVFYRRVKGDGSTQIGSLESGQWDYLGMALLSIWAICLAYPVKNFIFPSLNMLYAWCTLYGFLIVYHKVRRRQKAAIRARIIHIGQKSSHAELDDIVCEIKCFNRLFHAYAGALIIGGLLTVLLMFKEILFWDLTLNFLIALLACLNVLVFVEFRLIRSFLKYEYPNRHNKRTFVDDYYKNGRYTGSYMNFHFQNRNDIRAFPFAKLLVRLSDNTFYVPVLIVSILLVLIVQFAINYWIGEIAHEFNPINILIAHLIFVYCITIHALKHWIFHRQNESDVHGPRMRSFYGYPIPVSKLISRLLPSVIILIIVILFLIRRENNAIHQLSTIPEASDVLCMDQFAMTFKENHPKGSTIYSIAADGGGLKANLWNMLVLDEIYRTRKDIWNNTLQLSGVSGGALGMGNFLAALYQESDDTKRDVLISRIGAANILAIDLAGIFVRDLVMGFTGHENDDRSHFAMKYYADVLGFEETAFRTNSYRGFWKKMYDKHNEHVPLLNINTSSTGFQQGYALSVAHKKELPASIDILDNGNNTLSYYNAVSTSNRFPFASPAARIDGVGYFVDGGYFENSGILAAEHIKRKLYQEHRLDTMCYNHVYLNIQNARSIWVRQFIEKNHEWVVRSGIKHTEEIGAILSTLINLDKHPESIKERLIQDRYDSLQTLALPHLIDLEDLRNEFQGEIMLTDSLMAKMNTNNRRIRQTICSSPPHSNPCPIVTPPLARLLSRPAVEYERILVKDVVRQLPK